MEPDTQPACVKPGCGKLASDHLGWALGHLYAEPGTVESVLVATCTPNSQPFFTHEGESQCEHGYQINVLDSDLNILATINLLDWQSFRPASAGHRLIEHGYMIRPDARSTDTVNGWRAVGSGWIVPVIRTQEGE